MTNDSYQGSGTLTVRITGGGGAFPVQNANVSILTRESEDGGGGIIYSLKTNESGLTEKVTLPAPPKYESLSPDAKAPYSIYDIKASKDGYIDAENAGVQIFDGISAIQYFDLIPLSSFNSNEKRTNSDDLHFNGKYPNLSETEDNDL